MKRCPECRRDYFDESLRYCLDDGSALLEGPASMDEPATAVLSSASSGESRTRLFTSSEREVERPTAGVNAASKRNSIIVAALGLTLTTVLGLGSYVYYGRGPGKQIDSIAVMPFVNESRNNDLDYLSDGMTETLIRSLSQLPNLNVKSRASVFRYKGKEADAKAIGEELGVRAILNGRVVERGEQLTLNLELINSENENVIWAEQYDRTTSDLVTLQNEIARDVSSKLKLKLSGSDQQKLTKASTNDPEAYRLYLQARFYLNKRVGKLYERAEGYLQQAIEKDPNFALGYAGMADFVSQSDRPKAKEYAMRALALDDQLSEAHASLGFQYILDYNWTESGREIQRAIELDPNNAYAFQLKGARLLMLGRYEESIAAHDRAIEIEPTSADIRNSRAVVLEASGRMDQAIEYIKQSMELDPSFAWTHSHISFIYRMKGDQAASVAERARAAELLDQPDEATKLRDTFRAVGWTGYLRQLLQQNWGVLGRSPTRVASLQAELGQKEQAIASLNEAAEKGDWWLFSIKYDPAFDGIRNDSRFRELLKKFDLPH